MEPLACNSCSRSFSTAPALDRHRLRCRSRPRGRKKACTECSRSKARCDQGVPACSRCAVHALLCAYPGGGRLGETLSSSHPPPAVVSPSTLASYTPLSPSSNTPQSLWTSADALAPDLAGPSGPFYVAGCLSNAVEGWQEHFPFFDEAHSSSEGYLSNIDTFTAHSNSGSPTTGNTSPDPFQDLTAYLSERWRTAEDGLELIERVLKGDIDGLARGSSSPAFIHFRDWDQSHRPLVLSEAKGLAQLSATRTPDLDSLLFRSIDTQLLLIQRNITTHTRADDVSTAQAALLFAMMRIYRSGSTASECIDRVSLRLTQHVLSKSLHCMTPHTNVTASDWKSWIQDESLRRSFFTLHALDYVTHARQSLPTALCALFSDAPLPCPLHVWEAPTAEEWAVRYRAWEEYCSPGGPLRASDVLCWVQGKESGREEQLRVWFQGVGDALGGVVFECARAQARVAGVGGLL